LKINRWSIIYDKDPQIKRIGIFGLIYLIALLIVGFILLKWKFLLNPLFGGITSLLNFIWLKHLADSFLLKPSQSKIFYPAIKYVIRLALMAAVIYVIIRFTAFHTVGFILGFSAIVFGVMIESIYYIINGKRIGEG